MAELVSDQMQQNILYEWQHCMGLTGQKWIQEICFLSLSKSSDVGMKATWQDFLIFSANITQSTPCLWLTKKVNKTKGILKTAAEYTVFGNKKSLYLVPGD